MLRIAANFGAFLDAHNGPISAVSAVFVAAFTYTLWRTSSHQARLTRESIDLGNKAFISSNRPKIILRDIIYDGAKISYMLVNVGGTNATIVESYITTELVAPKDQLRPLRSFGHDDIGPLVIDGGKPEDLNYMVVDHHFFIMYPEARHIATDNQPRLDKHRLYFVGAILYSDECGVKRRSIFRRQWDDNSQSFVRINDPDQEYAD